MEQQDNSLNNDKNLNELISDSQKAVDNIIFTMTSGGLILLLNNFLSFRVLLLKGFFVTTLICWFINVVVIIFSHEFSKKAMSNFIKDKNYEKAPAEKKINLLNIITYSLLILGLIFLMIFVFYNLKCTIKFSVNNGHQTIDNNYISIQSNKGENKMSDEKKQGQIQQDNERKKINNSKINDEKPSEKKAMNFFVEPDTTTIKKPETTEGKK